MDTFLRIMGFCAGFHSYCVFMLAAAMSRLVLHVTAPHPHPNALSPPSPQCSLGLGEGDVGVPSMPEIHGHLVPTP